MFIFKLRPGESGCIDLTPLNFETATNKEAPYYMLNNKGAYSYYAVCPACNNPVVIVGLYGKDRPFARHHTHSVPRLTEYDADNFRCCPLANPGLTFPIELRLGVSDLSREIIRILRDNFDVVIKIIAQEVGIKISANMARKMLKQYLAASGYRYIRATLLNVPWAFARLIPANSLYMQYLYMDGPLYAAIREKIPIASFSDEGQLQAIGNGDLSFYFTDHKVDAHNQESYVFVLAYRVERDAPSQIIFKNQIIFDFGKFQRLISKDRKITESGQRLLSIASEIIPVPEAI